MELLLDLLASFGTSCGDANFVESLDFDGNCQIDLYDLMHVLATAFNGK